MSPDGTSVALPGMLEPVHARESHGLAEVTARAPAASPYIAQLDSLRAFAVLGVLLHHYGAAYFGHPFGALAQAGVQLFFVLSGFLITGILLRARLRAAQAGGSRLGILRRFYARRSLRIFPLYYLVVLTCVVLAVEPARDIVWWLLSYTLNIHMARQGWLEPNFAHFWSLSVEEQFYVGWPWFALLCPRRHLLPMAAAVAAAAPLYRLAYVLSGFSITTGLGVYISTPACLDALGAGAILAIASSSGPPRPWMRHAGRIALGAAIVVRLIAAAGVWENFSLVLYDTSQAVIFAWAVQASARSSSGIAGRLLRLSWLHYLGRISYGIYVYHPFIPALLAVLAASAGFAGWFVGWRGLVAATAGTLLIASLSWHLFEKPINDLKRRFDEPPIGVAPSPGQ
jgi:peptidoglycan/LPS O-acetylase OafA/YrhL